MEREGHATDGATASLRVSSVRISLQPIVTASYARCLHILPLFTRILSTLSVSAAVTRPLIDTTHPLRSQPINRRQHSRSLPRVLSLSLSVSFLNVFCPLSKRLSAHLLLMSAHLPFALTRLTYTVH